MFRSETKIVAKIHCATGGALAKLKMTLVKLSLVPWKCERTRESEYNIIMCLIQWGRKLLAETLTNCGHDNQRLNQKRGEGHIYSTEFFFSFLAELRLFLIKPWFILFRDSQQKRFPLSVVAAVGRKKDHGDLEVERERESIMNDWCDNHESWENTDFIFQQHIGPKMAWKMVDFQEPKRDARKN